MTSYWNPQQSGGLGGLGGFGQSQQATTPQMQTPSQLGQMQTPSQWGAPGNQPLPPPQMAPPGGVSQPPGTGIGYGGANTPWTGPDGKPLPPSNGFGAPSVPQQPPSGFFGGANNQPPPGAHLVGNQYYGADGNPLTSSWTSNDPLPNGQPNPAMNGNSNSPLAGIYQTLFNRAPDAAGQAYWQNALDHGVSSDAIAKAFANSAEYRAGHPDGSIPGFSAHYFDSPQSQMPGAGSNGPVMGRPRSPQQPNLSLLQSMFGQRT